MNDEIVPGFRCAHAGYDIRPSFETRSFRIAPQDEVGVWANMQGAKPFSGLILRSAAKPRVSKDGDVVRNSNIIFVSVQVYVIFGEERVFR